MLSTVHDGKEFLKNINVKTGHINGRNMVNVNFESNTSTKWIIRANYSNVSIRPFETIILDC